MKNYISSLTPFRGLAAIWIVIYHFDDITSFAGLPLLVPRENTMLLGKGYLWVDFFFLLSGFIITNVYGPKIREFSAKQIGSFIKARFARLYPLHFLLLIIHLIFFGLLTFRFPETAHAFSFLYPWDGLWIHFVFGETFGSINGLTWNPPAWSIGAEWWTYLLAIPALVWFYKRKSQAVAALSALGVSLLFLIPFLHEKGTLDTTYEFGLLRCIAEFSLGMVLYHLYQYSKARSVLKKDSIGLGLIGLILLSMHLGINDLVVVGLFGVTILALAYNGGKLRSILSRPAARFLGDISFSLYMFQALWLNIYWMGLKAWVEANPGVHPGAHVLILLLALVLGLNLLSAWLSYRYFEQAARRWVRDFRFKNLKLKLTT